MYVKKGDEKRVYSIKDNTGFGFPDSSEAGKIVQSKQTIDEAGVTTVDLDGNNIPTLRKQVLGKLGVYYFVMPASDVTIS